MGRLSIAATIGKKALAASRKGVAESVFSDVKVRSLRSFVREVKLTMSNAVVDCEDCRRIGSS